MNTNSITIQEILDAVNASQLTQYGAREVRHYANCAPCQGYNALFIAKALEVVGRANKQDVFIYRK